MAADIKPTIQHVSELQTSNDFTLSNVTVTTNDVTSFTSDVSQFGGNSNWKSVATDLSTLAVPSDTNSPTEQVPVVPLDIQWYNIEEYVTFETVRLLWFYASPTLIVFGSLGNFLSIVVFQSSTLKSTSTGLYLTVLAIMDILVLYTKVMHVWMLTLHGWSYASTRRWICKLFIFSSSFSTQMSSWLLVIILVERAIIVCKPLKSTRICTMQNAAITLGGFIVTFTGINLHSLWTQCNSTQAFNKSSHSTRQASYLALNRDNWPWVHIFISYIIPCLVVFFTCLVVFFKYSRSRHQRKDTMLMAISKLKPNRTTTLTGMLLVIGFLFVIFALPCAIYFLYAKTFTPQNHNFFRSDKNALAHSCLLLIVYAYHSTKVIFYYATATKFKREVLKLLRLRKSKPYVNNHIRPKVKYISEYGRRSDNKQTLNVPQLSVGNRTNSNIAISEMEATSCTATTPIDPPQSCNEGNESTQPIPSSSTNWM
ncbi:unnamed protein product [Owenia fusiformis]|uniref:Uncharacterized protein n=1 Tax=Owenia fusiformis TaxID=6347 RepID=A0A8J1UZZ3_OWEFU|nr:unnamed protein product [Owenia fusiformis]